jgi:hypothetical protein
MRKAAPTTVATPMASVIRFPLPAAVRKSGSPKRHASAPQAKAPPKSTASAAIHLTPRDTADLPCPAGTLQS